MLILGGGIIIGLEMGTVYSPLGAGLGVVEVLCGQMPGADRDLVKVWQKMNAPRFDLQLLKNKTVGAKATPAGIEVTFESAEPGGTAPAPQTYDSISINKYAIAATSKKLRSLAEAVRFELTEGINPRRFSRPVP